MTAVTTTPATVRTAPNYWLASLYGGLFAVPIFAQSILHYTSEDVGWMLAPGAFASAITMLVVGRVARRYDPRVVFVAGSLVLGSSLYLLGGLTPMTGRDDLMLPLYIRAIGTRCLPPGVGPGLQTRPTA